jgi:hypothetical protein
VEKTTAGARFLSACFIRKFERAGVFEAGGKRIIAGMLGGDRKTQPRRHLFIFVEQRGNIGRESDKKLRSAAVARILAF